MTHVEQTLWKRISQFSLDDTSVSFSFSERLARENGWSKTYSLRVIEEYKKFLLLSCVTQTGVTPSDPVDQAWHLHLTYTKSYWVDLCRNTLGKEIHHNPTKGGKKEAVKFDSFYTGSLSLYKEKFGVEPPKDIWPDNHTRFSDINFQRVNRARYWLVKKPSLATKKAVVVFCVGAVALLSIQASFDVSSYVFIGFLILIAVVAFRSKGKGGDGSGCSTTSSCSFDSGHSGHHGDSGCSGCSSSGCSGCGGGD